jgi:uroporphyrinogen-III synthase
MSGPLRGAGIVITRPARQAALLAQQIAAVGGTPLIFPTIAILPPDDTHALDDVRRRLAQFDYAISSARTPRNSALRSGYGPRRPRLRPGRHGGSACRGRDRRRPSAAHDDGQRRPAELDEFAAPAASARDVRGGAGRDPLGDTRPRGAHVTGSIATPDPPQSRRPSRHGANVASMRSPGEAAKADNLWEMLDRTAAASLP